MLVIVNCKWLIEKENNAINNNPLTIKRAVSENRTHDLFPTKEVLYP